LVFIIGWVADNFFPQVQRGAELEDKILIDEGERRGHEIIRMGKLTKDVDLYIVANCVDTFNIGDLLGYLSQKPYINIEHDLRAPQYPFYKMFAGDALINVYHSPLQRQLIERFAGKFNHFLHAMCLPDMFKDLGLRRRPKCEVLFVGDYSWEKGYRELVEWVEQQPKCIRIWHYGGGFEETHSKMVEKGYVDQKTMVQIYNQFKTLVFLPHYPQACSRVIAEAFLCKVPYIITNLKDGFSSYNWKPSDYDMVRKRLVNGHKLWWDKIEEVIKNEG